MDRPSTSARTSRPGPERTHPSSAASPRSAPAPRGWHTPCATNWESSATSGLRPSCASGTTGDPKGVVYSHRSIYLHSLQVNSAATFALTDHDTVFPVVPMFHVNAWGIPQAAFMAGTSLLMPDRFLQAAPLAEMIEAVRPTVAAAVPTIWQALLGELDAKQRDVLASGSPPSSWRTTS